MKVKISEPVTKRVEFEPVEINFTITSKDQLEMLYKLSTWDYSIPNLVFRNDPVLHTECARFLQLLNQACVRKNHELQLS